MAGAGDAGTSTLGSNFVVNRMDFGALRLSGPGFLGEPDDPAQARQVLLRAVEIGVQLIDTAHSYGSSERIIGETLAPVRLPNSRR